METTTKFNEVKEYYGKVLQGSNDLKTSACCNSESLPNYQKEILKEIEDEILTRFYGCGSPIPLALEGKTILDLGCGTGRDAFMAAKLAGTDGYVIGIDMTEEQLEVAKRNTNKQMAAFGFSEPNVSFRTGYIEDLATAGIEDNSVDVVISNCVINLSPDKKQVFSEIFRVLKPGGELYFSDVFADRRIPEELQDDPVLYGECLSGAMYIEDFRRLLRDFGCPDYRLVSQSQISLDNPEIEEKAGMINFYSMTIRAFKLDSLEDICEDYGQVAVYKGTIPHAPHRFALDDHHIFETGKPMLVCGNTAAMLEETRFNDYFKVTGDKSVHHGAFDCGVSNSSSGDDSLTACC
ncbi:methyltransferase domain-containing protein [Rhodohalobacter sp.]|uniref:methyltransferase domain-containing protein n=1 Tax=Rhodohalobacter sp. TaxID=1974210 RepID=UPI002ACEBF9F|nr:methyltransferase domain-containing protein [Rhodohalobacter sp.]MDZ7755555.1 methyltransferase domain-containing protein [Rhodohalobacter sp.]